MLVIISSMLLFAFYGLNIFKSVKYSCLLAKELDQLVIIVFSVFTLQFVIATNKYGHRSYAE